MRNNVSKQKEYKKSAIYRKKMFRAAKDVVHAYLQNPKKEIKAEQERGRKYLETSEFTNIRALPEYACTGCEACINVCPEKAIRLSRNKDGFPVPYVDEKKCVKCGLCQKKCPELSLEFPKNETADCYAVQAENKKKFASSAGGFFYVAAEKIIKEQGYVCGVFTDNDLMARFTIINEVDKISKLSKTKYMQAEIGSCYKDMKALLEQGKKVLFCGCPCQIAAFRKVLSKEYENLLTIDFVCDGMASPESFKKYYQEMFGERPVWIDYSCKSVFEGKDKGIKLMQRNGEEYLAGAEKDPYLKAYHSGLNKRSACGTCNYALEVRQGDITLADFSEVKQWREHFDDRKGTTLARLNNKKAQKFYDTIKTDFEKQEAVPKTIVKYFNHFARKPRVAELDKRRHFFEELQLNTLEKSVEYARNDKYDVAVLGLWFGRNYGSMMTYYALHQVLRGEGLSVLMIHNPLASEYENWNAKTHPVKFGMEHYHVSPIVPLEALESLNEHADTFLIGSDQLWNYWLSRPYGQAYYLQFVADNKKKIAYGTSFGSEKYNGPEGQRKLVQANLRRMDAISVREDYAVDVCKDTFGVEAVKVLDPVFLCDRKAYELLVAETGKKKEESYIFAYILNPSKEIGAMLQRLGEKYQKKVLVALDEPPWLFAENKAALELPENSNVTILEEVEVKEWLFYFKYADYCITDSFHGSCFSILFERKFAAIVNKKRGSARFPSLLSHFGLMGRLVQEPEEILADDWLLEEIDYEKVFQIIEEDKRQSMDWLKQALYTPKEVTTHRVYKTVEKEESHDI